LHRISPNLRAIPNWHLTGNPSPPEILSNKVVLTPPAPGNQRGAIWSEKPLQHSEWTVDLDFRATGPERGGGKLQIWYAKNGQADIGTASVYTVGRFDGLALIIDQYAGSGGYIRGFLNDGSTDYKNHHSVDSIAFGHCEYSYRNLGRPSRLAIKHTAHSFSVRIDGTLCFESSKIKLPIGYNFGISAVSAENPDSFEIFQFVTTTESHSPDVVGAQDHQYSASQTQDEHHESNQKQNSGDIPAFSDPPDEAPEKYTSSAEQFADLHNRLQVMMKHISTAHRDHMTFETDTNAHYRDVILRLEALTNSVQSIKSIQQGLDTKLESVSKETNKIKHELHNALERHITGLKNEVRGTKDSMLEGVANSGGIGWGGLILVVVGSQVVTAGAYVLYKRRKSGNHMKYL
jgi:mannose-binding lectin 1